MIPITARWTWKLVSLWLLAVVIAAGVVYWWQFVRLSLLEQQVAGNWEGTRVSSSHRTIKLYCELRADRTAAVEFVSLPAQPGQTLPQRIRLKQPTWHETDGHLRFHECLSLWTGLQLDYYRIRAVFPGGTQGDFRQIDGLGPIRNLRAGAFEMGEWHMERVNSLPPTD